MVVQLYEFDISKDYPKLQRTNKYDIFIPKHFSWRLFHQLNENWYYELLQQKSLRFLIK